jgi:hypothetical protein
MSQSTSTQDHAMSPLFQVDNQVNGTVKDWSQTFQFGVTMTQLSVIGLHGKVMEKVSGVTDCRESHQASSTSCSRSHGGLYAGGNFRLCLIHSKTSDWAKLGLLASFE